MIFNFIAKSFRNTARLACGSLVALTLASCGGGGGSAGTVANTPTTTTTTTGTVASVALTFSSPQLLATTPSGSGVTVTAIVEDANHNGLAGVTVTFSADSGVIVPTTTAGTTAAAVATTTPTVVTAADGTVTATLGTGGNVTPRTIHVTVTAGGQSATGSVAVVASVTVQPAIQLLFSPSTLASTGTAATAVTVTALLEDANNNALSGVPVTFTANSGILTVTQATSDVNGHATATLSTAGNPMNRSISVTASGGGTTVSGVVNVTGTTITATSAPTALTINTLAKFIFNVQDSAGNPIAKAPVTFSSAVGNPIVGDAADAGTAAAPVTDVNGNVTLDVTPTKSGADTLTVSAEGASGQAAFSTSSQSLSVTLTDNKTSPATTLNVTPQPIPEYTSTSCIQIGATYSSGGGSSAGTALVNTSRGTLYLDPACSVPLSLYNSQWSFGSTGVMTPLYLSSTTIGTATVTVSESTGTVSGPSQSASVTFIAQLSGTSTPNITLSANPAIVAPNTNSVNPTAQFSVLTATVRDGTSNNNLVQGVPVKFTLVTDSSGGYISPSVVVTQSNGQAQANYYPGSGTTAQNGVQVLAAIQSTVATNSVQIPLTVSGSALFVTLGTGNTINVPSDTTYSQDWAVVVTDSAGHPVVGATVIGQLVALNYTKGVLRYNGAEWVINPGTDLSSATSFVFSETPTDGSTISGAVNTTSPTANYWCPNTDIANTGVWSPTNPPFAEQIYYPSVYALNPSLAGTTYKSVMPGIPGSVTPSGVTDAAGSATVTVTYPKDHAVWTNVALTVTASTSGSQSSATAFIEPLEGVAADYNSATIAPPGQTSPYGVNNCVTAF